MVLHSGLHVHAHVENPGAVVAGKDRAIVRFGGESAECVGWANKVVERRGCAASSWTAYVYHLE